MNVEVIIGALLILVAYNLYASWVCLRSPDFEGIQKMLQLLLIWILPVLGAGLVTYIAKSMSPSYRSNNMAAPDQTTGNPD